MEHHKWGTGVKELPTPAVSDQVAGAAGMVQHGEVVDNDTTLPVLVVSITVMAGEDEFAVWAICPDGRWLAEALHCGFLWFLSVVAG